MSLTRTELVERLKKLAESKPPRNLAPGACCYYPAGPHICLKCGNWGYYGQIDIDEIVARYKEPVERLREIGLDVTLIVPELCPQCGQPLERKKYRLKINYPDLQESVPVELESEYDIELMTLFLQGKDRYDAGQSGEASLKGEIERLRELFGVAEE